MKHSAALTAVLTLALAGSAYGISGEGYFGPDTPLPSGIDIPSVVIPNTVKKTPSPIQKKQDERKQDDFRKKQDELKLSPKHEKYSEDLTKVIRSYSLDEAKTSELLDLHHAASRGIGNQEKINRYSVIIEAYPIDYFAAYNAAVAAYAMVDYDEAMYWITKCLDTCPDYMPARRLKKKIDGMPH